jgi:hypothetical protein
VLLIGFIFWESGKNESLFLDHSAKGFDGEHDAVLSR